MRGNGRSVNDETRLIDHSRRFLSRLAAHGINAVCARIHGQQCAEDVFVPGVAGFIDGLQQAIHFVGLKQHRRRQKQGILQSFAGGKFLAE